MNDFAIIRKEKEIGNHGINLQEYVAANREAIDRISINKGKVSYDLSQTKMIHDVLGISGNAIMQVGQMFTTGKSNRELSEMSIREQAKAMIEKDKEMQIAMKPYRDKAYKYKQSIDDELNNEVSGVQSFVAGAAIHSLRQGLDVRQWPMLLASSVIGGAIGSGAGRAFSGLMRETVGQRIGSAIGRFAEEFGEELTDQYINEGEIDIGSAIQSGVGAVIIGEVPFAVKKTLGKAGSVLGVGAKADSNIKADTSKADADYIKKVEEAGSETAVKLDDASAVAETVEVYTRLKGKNTDSQEVLKKAVTIEGTTVKTAGEEYLPRIVKFIVDSNSEKGIKSQKDFINLVKEKPEEAKKILRKVATRKDLPDDIKEAVEWYNKVFDEERIKNVDINAKELINATDEALNGTTKYEPVFKKTKVIEKGYPFTENEVNAQEFEVRSKDRIKHNYKDFKVGQLEADLVKDLKIPKKAKIGKVRGAIPKTPYKIKSNVDADGKPVYVRKKWEHGSPQADIDWTYNGYKYYARVEQIDGKWRGEVYKTKIEEPKTKKKVKAKTNSETSKAETAQPNNIVEDIYGVFDVEEAKKERFQDMRDYIIKVLELNEKVTRDNVERTQLKIMKEFGRVVKERHNFKSIDEAIDYYKKKYNIEFSFHTNKADGEFGSVEIGTIGGKREIRLYIREDVLKDDDYAYGALRHEIQHIIEYSQNPKFRGKRYTGNQKQGQTLADFIDEATGGHFSVDNNTSYELNYIVNNELDNFFYGDKVETMALEKLGVENVPETLDEGDIKVIQEAVKDGKGEEAAKRLKKLKTQLNNYFTIKRGLSDILYSDYDAGTKATMAKEFLRTNLLLPFYNAETQMKNAILKAFEIEVDGNKLNPKKVLDMFEENDCNFIDYVFYKGKLTEELESLRPQLETLKLQLNKIVDDIQEKSIAKRDDIINTLCYDRNLTIENLIPDSEIIKWLDNNKNFDLEKFMNGKAVTDELTGTKVAERILPVREKFAELNFQHFNSAVDVLEHEFNRKELKPERIVKAMQEARKCMTAKDFEKTLKKYKAEEIPEVKKFLSEHPEILEEIENQDIDAAIIKSKKENAMRFFTKDMQSFKGTEDNPAKGTYAHKLARFVDAEYEGYISHANVTNFVRANKVDQRLAVSKFLRDISSAHAIKETFPKMGNTGFNVMFDVMQKESGNPYTKTFIGELEAYIKAELGEKLGIANKPSKAKLDRIVKNLIRYQNKINLSGPKAIKELGQEPLSMARASVMLYGGKGFLGTYENIMKAFSILMQHGEILEKYNKALGGKWKDSIPLEFYNIIQDDLNDFTGYRNARIKKFGTKGEKIMASIDSGLDLVNMYSHTQRIMKLASYITGGDTLDKLTSYKNLDELFKNSPHYVKKLAKDLEIDDAEYALIKSFKETKVFKELGVFDEVEFKDSLTLEKYSKVLGRDITEEEFKVLSEATTKKAKKMYDKIVSDISPTETTGAGRFEIEMIQDPIRRNFMRLMSNFKSSIQEQWRRAVRDYYMSNVDETGKFDWSNKVWQKQLMSNIVGTGMAIAAISTVSDAEFYADPIEYISEKIDELIDEPGSALWGAIAENFNLWGLTTGSNVVRRPIAFAGQVSKGEWGEAGVTLLKGAIGTTNFNLAKKGYDFLY